MPIRPENRDRYPADWPAIRERILKRSMDTSNAKWMQCECCGECDRGHGPLRCRAINGESHPDTGSTVVLTIAHLDHQPEHCDPSNLKAMCQACHLAYDAEHHAAERWRNERRELELRGQQDMFK